MKHPPKLIIFIIFIITISVSAQKNLVRNGGFEKGLTNWRGDAATISPYDKKMGKNSCLISQYVGAEWKGIDQIINLPKNTYALEFSIWIKTDAIEVGKEQYNAGITTLEFMGAGDSNISYENIAQLLGTTSWTLYTKQIVVPKKSKKLRIMLALAQTTGVILFDDIKLVGISESDYLENNKNEIDNRFSQIAGNSEAKILLNGDFENGSKHWTGTGEIISTEKKEGYSSVSISSIKNTWVHIDQTVDISDKIKAIKFSGWLKSENIVQGDNPWNNGLLIVEFTKDGLSKTTEDQVIGNITGIKDWTFFEQTLSVPNGTTKYRIILALSNCIGTLLADDIKSTLIQ